MQFINIFMLLGLAAIAIPILIQIFNRKNARKISWGAWLFLDVTVQKRKRKVLLEDILLLACRCLGLGLLALGFARPFVRPDSPVPWAVTLPVFLLAIVAVGISFALWRYPKARWTMFLGGVALFALAIATVVFERQLNLKRFGLGATKDVVLIIDGSASMSFVNDGKSNFDRAVEEAKKYVELAPRDTSFAVIIGGPVPQVMNPVPVADRRIVLGTLDRIRPSNGTMQVAGSLTAAAVTLAAGRNGVKQIVLVGDGQAVGWHLDDRDRWQTIAKVFDSLKTKPVITWRTLPMPTSIRNLAVADVRPWRDVVGTDRDVKIDVTVVNAGTEAVTPAAVTLTAGGTVLAADGLRQLEPGERQTFTFRHRFKEAGGTVITAHVEPNDDLAADDTCNYAMSVMGSLKILIADGDATSSYMERAATYVSLALRPEIVKAVQKSAPDAAEPAPAKDFLIETTVEDVVTTGSRRSFGGYAAVVLSGVRRLPEGCLKSLAQFVKSGGGLFVMPSPSSDAAAFDGWTDGGERVLPAPFGAWRENRSPLDPSSFREALAKFRVGTDLGGVTPLTTMDFGENFSTNATVLARLTDGTPLLLSRPFGHGTIVESSLRFDPASGLVSKRAFLPFLHELAYSLVRPASVKLDCAPAENLDLLVASGAASGEVAGRSGLVASYYPQPHYQGRPIVRVDAPKEFGFNWGGNSPVKGIPADNFSVVWRGFLTPPETGLYRFVINVDDRAYLKIGDRELRTNGDLYLTADTPYSFNLRYEEDYGKARVMVLWRKPGEARETAIPLSCLRTGVAGVATVGDVVTVTDPHGETFYGEIYTADAGHLLRITRSVMPGVYTVSEIPEQYLDSLGGVIGSDGKLRFTVSAGVEESTLQAVTQTELEKLCKYVQISQATKEEDVVKAIGGEGFGKEVWRFLAFFAFLFLVLEPAIARWIAKNRRTGDQIDTEGSWTRI